MVLEKIYAKFETELIAGYTVTMWIDGEKDRCKIRTYDVILDEYAEQELYFSYDNIRILNVKNMFIDTMWKLFSKSFSMGELPFSGRNIDMSNPEYAWLSYKRTFMQVMHGDIYRNKQTYELEMVGELLTGSKVVIRDTESMGVRISVNGTDLGQMSIDVDENRNELFVDKRDFLVMTKGMDIPKIRISYLVDNSEIGIESGVVVYNISDFDSLLEGIEEAVLFLRDGITISGD